MMSIPNVPIILILARLSKNLSGKPCQTTGWQTLAFWCSESHRSGARGRPDAPPPLLPMNSSNAKPKPRRGSTSRRRGARPTRWRRAARSAGATRSAGRTGSAPPANRHGPDPPAPINSYIYRCSWR